MGELFHRCVGCLSAVLAALILCLPAAGQEGTPLSPKVVKMLDRAAQALEERRLERAIGFYQRAEDLHGSRLFVAQDGKSRAHLLEGRYGPSLLAAERALELATSEVDRAVSLNRIGALRFDTAYITASGEEVLDPEPRLDRAEEALRQSIEISQGHYAMPWLNLAELLYNRDRLAEAKAAIENHLAIAPEEARTLQAERLAACLDQKVRHSDSRPVRLGESEPDEQQAEVRRPRKISGANPQYTAAARFTRVQGVVILELLITEVGDVVCVKVLKGMPFGMSRMSAETVYGWKFEPATLGGRPVTVYYNLTINFRLARNS